MNNNLSYTLPELPNYSKEDYEASNQLVLSLFNRIANDLGPASLPYWLDKFSSHKQGNRMIIKLAKEGMVKTKITHNYAQIEMSTKWLLSQYTQDELDNLIIATKLSRYLPIKPKKVSQPQATKVRLVSGVKESGLVRFGFAEAGTHKFKYDIPMLRKYKAEVVKFSVKSMEKMEAKLSKSLRNEPGYDYQSIIERAIDVIIETDAEYVLGELMLDSRGRAIYECLRTIFNPISNKMARALVIAPGIKPNNNGIENAMLFIAELCKGFEPDIDKKIEIGIDCYVNREYHDLDTSTEKGLDAAFENIWLERLYKDLEAVEADSNHLVTTPVEVDFSSSNLVLLGLLLDHKEYYDSSKYMWDISGLTKQHVKFAQTPYVFGSTSPISKLWDKNRLEYTSEQVAIMKEAQTKGKFTVANEFKDIIINHCHPTAEVNMVIDREQFVVECNKVKHVGDTTKQYVALDTESNKFKVIHHTNTHSIPDLQQFKRYFVTGLIHNIDSQILDNICMKSEWMIPIHDASVCTWNGATDVRAQALVEMKHINDNGRDIIYNYFKSINVDVKGMVKLKNLYTKIDNLNSTSRITISQYLMK